MINKKALTVTELTKVLKNCLNLQFPGISVIGVISDVYRAEEYTVFSLNEVGSKIKCVQMSTNANSNIVVDVGDKVRANGTISVFGKSGEIHILVSRLEVLASNFRESEDRLKKFPNSGAEVKNKKAVDFELLIRSVGIITSVDGAALSDILSVVRDELPYLDIKIFPAVMQGKNAFESFGNCVDQILCHKDIDILIITRGGGSYEDLSVFNSKNIANLFRLVKIPIISAIGHAKDDVLLNHVADFNVATPTSAIQKIVANKNKFKSRIRELENNLSNSIQRLLMKKTNEMKNVLALLHTPLRTTEKHIRSLEALEKRASRVFHGVLLARKQQLLQLETIIEKLRKSNKKYSRNPVIFTKDKKKVIKSVHELRREEVLAIKFKDGQVKVKVLNN
ncbi:MAG: exodeoxyribonuclease VII large subunit [Burkholderiaceae bacterium]